MCVQKGFLEVWFSKRFRVVHVTWHTFFYDEALWFFSEYEYRSNISSFVRLFSCFQLCSPKLCACFARYMPSLIGSYK